MRARKQLLVGATSLATVVAAIGVLHMPFARGLLARAGGCPVGHAKLAEIEPARMAAIAADRGSVAAPARPALGFRLDETTPKEVRAWAGKTGVSCEEAREGLLRCKNVPAASLGLPEHDGPVGELYFGFNTRGRLVDVSTMRMHVPNAGEARDIEARLESQP